ncbi:MAG: cysteine hydrolase family protein [Pseudomonadota bacterium]
MIKQFKSNTALLLIDVQKGVNVFDHWGGPTGRRNNPDAEDHMARLMAAFRQAGLPVMFTKHDSREEASPLKLSLPTGAMIEGFDPQPGDVVVTKDVNSAFIGTDMELRLRQHGVNRLVIAGFFTNFCVETSTRMAGNMGYDTYLAHQACATTNRIGLDGTDYDPDLVHAMSVASLHGEFCTTLNTTDLLALVEEDAPHLDRVQGNE